MPKEFTIDTHDIQRTIIALIWADTDTNRPSGIPHEWFEKAEGLLSSWNQMCTAANNYTLKITIEEGPHHD